MPQTHSPLGANIRIKKWKAIKKERQKLGPDGLPSYDVCTARAHQLVLSGGDRIGDYTVCVMWLPEMWRLPWVETGKGGHPSSRIMTKELVFVSLLSEAQA